MEDLHSSLAIAADQYDNGQIKVKIRTCVNIFVSNFVMQDAYNTFLALAQQSMRPLFDVKFVHCC